MDPNDLRKIRTDVVGSLLRPAYLKEARIRFDEGKIGEDDLSRIEDQAVRDAVLLQEQVGLDVVTDGEYRRLNFQDSFGASVTGFDASRSDIGFYEKRVAGSKPLQRWEIPDREIKGTAVAQRRPVVERLRLAQNLPLNEYLAVSRTAQRPVKVTLIGPDRICQRFDYENSTSVYRTIDGFMADVVKIEREIVGSLAAASCRYIQIDAPGYTAYVDPPSLEKMRQRGEDPMDNFSRSLRADNEVLRGFEDVTFGIHLCRGNQQSMWHREGAYDAIAEKLFSTLGHHRFLLEYDSPRAGSFDPLRFVPKGKTVVLGLVSTKVPQLEKIDDKTAAVILQNSTLDNFSDSHISRGSGASIEFGDGTTLSLAADESLSVPWTFSGNTVIDGQGTSLTLVDGGSISVLPDSHLTINNVIIEGLSQFNLVCDATSSIIFHNTRLAIPSVYHFATGSFSVASLLSISGPGIFVYSSIEASTILPHSELLFSPGVTLEYAPTNTFPYLLWFTDSTSKLHLSNASLHIRDDGMQMHTGTLMVSHHNYLYTDAVLDIDGYGFIIGTGVEEENLYINIASGGSLDIVHGFLDYRNVEVV